MSDPYARLKRILADPSALSDSDDSEDLILEPYREGRAPTLKDTIPGWGLSARMLRELLDAPGSVVKFMGYPGEADARRQGMNDLLRRVDSDRVVSVRRLDAGAAGGVDRKSPWEASLVVAMPRKVVNAGNYAEVVK